MAKKKTVGQLIDEVWEYDLRIDKMEKELREVKKEREALEMELLTAMRQAEITASKGTRAAAAIRKTTYPSIADRLKFQKFVLKNKAFELYQNRISSTAYHERKEAGILVPGVKEFEKTYVSITGKRNK